MNAKVTKILTHVVAFFLGAAIGAGIYGAVDNIPKTDVSGENPTGSVYGGGLMPGDIEESGVTLTRTAIPVAQYDEYGISPIAESAYTLTATVMPEDATFKDVTFTYAWKTSNSALISEYVTLSEKKEGKAILECLKAFSTPIIVTVTSDFDDSKKATCQLDYLKRLESITVQLDGGGTLKLNTPTTYQITPTYGAGTINGTLTVTKCDFDNYSTIVDKIKAESVYKTLSSKYGGYYIQEGMQSVSVDENSVTFNADGLFTYGKPFSAFSSEDQTSIKNMVAKVLSNIHDSQIGQLTFTVTYTGGSINDTKTCNAAIHYYDVTAIITPVSNVTVNEGNYIF